LFPRVEGEPAGPSVKKIFKEKFHSTWDNYFSGDVIMDWLGTNGFGATMTCRRDRLLFGVPGRYVHKQKTFFPENKGSSSSPTRYCNQRR